MRSENRMCSHPRTGDATDEKIAEKNREKFNELNFLRQSHGLRQRVATRVIFAVRWRPDNFKKIASPSQAKNRSCSRALRSRRSKYRHLQIYLSPDFSLDRTVKHTCLVTTLLHWWCLVHGKELTDKAIIRISGIFPVIPGVG